MTDVTSQQTGRFILHSYNSYQNRIRTVYIVQQPSHNVFLDLLTIFCGSCQESNPVRKCRVINEMITFILHDHVDPKPI